MRSAVDSSIILDIFLDDPEYAESSMSLLEQHLLSGPVVICPVAYAESAASLLPPIKFSDIVLQMGLVYDDFDPEICTLAAQMWRAYRLQGGPRQRILGGFLIGAHALRRADCLISRDRGFYRAYFHGLKIMDPASAR